MSGRRKGRVATLAAACALGLLAAAPIERTPIEQTGGGDEEELGPRFGDDLAFLREHTELAILSAEAGQAQVAVAPGYQGRVLTSTAAGAEGLSHGWIHRELIASGERRPHMNPFGGEDRFWLGPEGGQFALYFRPGDPFDLEHWQVPEPLDWGAWPVLEQNRRLVRFRKDMELANYAGTRFRLTVERTVRILRRHEIAERLAMEEEDLEGVRLVAFESVNTIVNRGEEAWRKETGLVSIWILGMFHPSPETVVVVPFVAGPEDELGPVVNDAYFGKVPADRLVIDDDVLFFRGDGAHRSKIGIPRPRAVPTLGSYDAKRGVLTVVQYTLPKDATDYVNSLWEIQDEPYAGDVVNSYNDGPPAPGASPLGPFYELESSSPAAALAPGESLTHEHRTIHLEGPEAVLDRIARRTFGVGLARIASVFR